MVKLFLGRYALRLMLIGVWLLLAIVALAILRWEYFSKPENSITVFTWGGLIDPHYIKQFEQQTGIKVTISYYSTNEELLVTMKATNGRGYDLIVPSDYAVNILRKQGILKKIDKSKLTFLNSLDPLLLGRDFDQTNDYSLPYAWEIFGFGIDKDYFSSIQFDKFSWKTVFCTPLGFKITMVNDPIEAALFGYYYLYGTEPQNIPIIKEQRDKIEKALLCQKKWVEAYTDFRADYFLITRNCPLVVTSSSYILRSMREYPYIDFVIPQDGSFITIENMAIPIASSKESLVYKFLNFLYSLRAFKHHYGLYAFLPALKPDFAQEMGLDKGSFKLLEQFHQASSRFSFFRPIMPEVALQRLWVGVKSNI
ncbi:MAG TPA: extracellular solute-binding protein [Candidatus Babeliaceae bacterium]|nr:extracellular solute-binding protein [Candidatus Babeliaceae bacterium]